MMNSLLLMVNKYKINLKVCVIQCDPITFRLF